MSVEETIKGSGGLCGAILLDKGFLRLAREIIPRDAWEHAGPVGIDHLMSFEWEDSIKCSCDGNSSSYEFFFPFGSKPGNIKVPW